jgi:hypothetical protein
MIQKPLIYLISIFILLSCSNREKKVVASELKSYSGLNSSEKLIQETFFKKMTLLIPENYNRTGNQTAGNIFDMINIESQDNTVWIHIRTMTNTDLESVKEVHESMASEFYNGNILKSELSDKNSHKVYLFEMTGYWNGSKIKESWMKYFVVANEITYQFLIKYPERDRVSTVEFRNKIIESIKIKK